MTKLENLIMQIKEDSQCVYHPPVGLPSIQEGHILPEDVQRFYQLCGGLVMFEHSEGRIEILPPGEVVLANQVVFLGIPEEQLAATKHEPSWSWYLIGQGDSGEYLAIDLAPTRLGRCYYGFWDSFAMKGHSPVIAHSFTEFLERLWENKGKSRYWEQPSFQPLSDAYDLI